jgi:hypothetical protein
MYTIYMLTFGTIVLYLFISMLAMCKWIIISILIKLSSLLFLKKKLSDTFKKDKTLLSHQKIRCGRKFIWSVTLY